MKTLNKTYIILLLLLPIHLTGCNYLSGAINYKLSAKPRYASLNIAEDTVLKSNKIKVISYNIKHAKNIDNAIDLFSEDEDLSGADIILLQEMTPKKVEKIAKTLKYNYVFYPAILHPVLKKDFGNAILSKWPILDDQKIILPSIKTNWRQRIAVYASLQIEEKKVGVVSLHMGILITPKNRRRLVEIILDPVPKDLEYCIIGGDFNSFTKKDQTHISSSFTKADYSYATRYIGWTYNQWYLFNRKITLDHIFVKGLTPLESGKVISKKTSDHLPIWAELKFP